MNTEKNDFPISAWFLGPKAEHGSTLTDWFTYILQDYMHWRRNYFPTDSVVISRETRRTHGAWQDQLNTHLDLILNHLKADFPFYSPRYIAHMTSEQTLPSILGYFAGMLYNPNNVTDEAAPVTVRLELEVGRMVSEMLGYHPKRAWAHICSGGTIANLESMWVARMAQFIPFIIRDYCKTNAPHFEVRMANGQHARLIELGDRALIGLRPNQSITMTRKLARYEVEVLGRDQPSVLHAINQSINTSDYNVKLRGFSNVVRKLNMRPVLFASATAHYCIKKVANVLGYGEDSVRSVHVTSKFRIDCDALQDVLNTMRDEEYIASVVGIVGTTEEGAVDPIHEIVAIRENQSHEMNRSFWLHVDAAWGGYIRSIFCGDDLPSERVATGEQVADIDTMIKAVDATDVLPSDYLSESSAKGQRIAWDDPDVYKAFLAMSAADSIAIDPHKMGYTPYPAGIVAFKNGLVTELMTQRAQYISDEEEGIKAIDRMIEIKAVGPYILEGSKPGAAATSCWLAHSTIPLNSKGHGKIVRTSLLSAKRLFCYLKQHREKFAGFETALGVNNGKSFEHPFAFIPLFEPDTNIVCFVCAPMEWNEGQLRAKHVALKWVNDLNKRIHFELDIPKARRGMLTPYAKEYFVSNTMFVHRQYSSASISSLLTQLRVSAEEYESQGLIVLRSTVMNPLYETAREEGTDYLAGFVKHLHGVARFVIEQKKMSDEGGINPSPNQPIR
jgi:glutamate/tyrosine decarboxylase-like PLP-dependent enzyme